MVPWKGFVQIPNLGHIFLFVPSFIFVVVHIQLSIILMVSSYCCHSAAVFWKQVQYLDISLSLSICVWTQIAEWNYYLTCISDIIAPADIVSCYIITNLLYTVCSFRYFYSVFIPGIWQSVTISLPFISWLFILIHAILQLLMELLLPLRRNCRLF